MAQVKLSDAEVQANLQSLVGWEVEQGKLHKVFHFSSFVTAFGWMSAVALVAESLNHHPEWFNVYSRVVVDLMTHDVVGISTLDFTLAQRMDELVVRGYK